MQNRVSAEIDLDHEERILQMEERKVASQKAMLEIQEKKLKLQEKELELRERDHRLGIGFSLPNGISNYPPEHNNSQNNSAINPRGINDNMNSVENTSSFNDVVNDGNSKIPSNNTITVITSPHGTNFNHASNSIPTNNTHSLNYSPILDKTSNVQKVESTGRKKVTLYVDSKGEVLHVEGGIEFYQTLFDYTMRLFGPTIDKPWPQQPKDKKKELEEFMAIEYGHCFDKRWMKSMACNQLHNKRGYFKNVLKKDGKTPPEPYVGKETWNILKKETKRGRKDKNMSI